MWEVIWLDSAVNDIARLKQFIAQENTAAAKKAAAAIKDAAQRLMQTPLIGKPVEDLPPYRDLFTRFGGGGYILRYRMLMKTIYIVHVRHYREENFK